MDFVNINFMTVFKFEHIIDNFHMCPYSKSVMKLSDMLTIEETAKALEVSTRTLLRWEKNAYLVPYKKGSSIRLYDPNVVNYWKIMLQLDRKMEKHLKLLKGLRKRLNKHNLEQDYFPGKKLKVMIEKDMKLFSDACDEMEQWNKDYEELLHSMMEFPRSMLKATIEKY